MGVLGILISLGLLMYLAYRGINVLILAPIMALLAVLIGGGVDVLLPTYTQVFMQALGNYLLKFFPLFMLGAIFGKLMADSGSAKTIAHWIVTKVGKNHAILAIVLSCGILTYGGVSLFVVAFAVYPIGAALFREIGTPKRFIPGAIALGSFTFTMTAFPGTPAIQNAIPIPFFGTNTFAAPGLGTIAGLIMMIGGVLWLNIRAKRAMSAGEGYGDHPHETFAADAENETVEGPSILLALLPILLVIGLNAAFTYLVFPNIDASYLAEAKYGSTKLSAVAGLWSIIVALVIAIVFIIVAHWQRWKNVIQSLNEGTMGSLLPVFNTASEVGYGNVIASLPAFLVVKNAVLGISQNPLVSEAVAVNILAGITGSASGGMSIALSTLGAKYLELANATGISPELLHRVATLSSGGLDALPHNGAVITLLGICRLTHKQSYFDIFIVAVAIPLIALAVVLTLGTMFGNF
ncbi:MAG: GntP family permease [Candidatus Competibacteraceae bacterium]|nr:GntP family permease [Candidatus Competibacteraceae bacterium]